MTKFNASKILKNSVYIIFIIILVGYAIFNSRIFIAGPQINVDSPATGSTIKDSPFVKIKGSARNIAFINLNGRRINVNEESYFDEPVLLYPGYNIIRVDAIDKFEREIEKKIELVYLENY